MKALHKHHWTLDPFFPLLLSVAMQREVGKSELFRFNIIYIKLQEMLNIHISKKPTTSKNPQCGNIYIS